MLPPDPPRESCELEVPPDEAAVRLAVTLDPLPLSATPALIMAAIAPVVLSVTVSPDVPKPVTALLIAVVMPLEFRLNVAPVIETEPSA